jgi:putative tricarboxylic transport membrane protein
MSETANESGGAGPSHRSVEVGVAVVMAGLALIGIVGSLRVGIGWGAEGPQAGFFPFYVSLLVIISCAVNLVQILKSADEGNRFATWAQLRLVMAVTVPTTIYVFIIPYSGIYVASALLIVAFMIRLGKYRWTAATAVAIVVPILTFMLFEIWFLVPLPKGPLEHFLGY